MADPSVSTPDPAPDAPLVAVILPPREGFGPGRSGALGLLARRHATAPGFRTLVFGGPQAGSPFTEVPFQPIHAAWWWPGNVNLRYAAALVPALRRARPDLIEVHNRPEIALALARVFRHTPVGLLLNNDPAGMRAARSPAARARLARRVRPLMAASDWVRRRFLAGLDNTIFRTSVSGDQPPEVEVVHNCIDLNAVPPPGPRENLILFAGRVVHDKAPDRFVEACALALPSLPGWRAELIGADGMSAESRETDFVRAVRMQAGAAGVIMLGYRDHPLVLLAMARAAIVVMPSRWEEPFGLTALEAIACGAALIVSPRGGLPEIAGDAAVYVDPEDPRAIAAAIIALAGDPDRRAAMGLAGRQRAKAFDTPTVVAKLAALRLAALRR